MGEIDREDAVALARALREVLDQTRHRVGGGTRSALVDRITEHIGHPLADIPNVTLDLQPWEHVNLHEGVTAYVAAHTPGAAWFGVAGASRAHQDLMDLLSGAEQHGMFQLGAVDYTAQAAGPDRIVDTVQLGFVATRAPDGAPVVVGVRGGIARYGQPTCELRVLAACRETATAGARRDPAAHRGARRVPGRGAHVRRQRVRGQRAGVVPAAARAGPARCSRSTSTSTRATSWCRSCRGPSWTAPTSSCPTACSTPSSGTSCARAPTPPGSARTASTSSAACCCTARPAPARRTPCGSCSAG